MSDDGGYKVMSLEQQLEMVISDNAQKTPLVEMLRSVPKTHRTEWEIQWAEDGTATGHAMSPIGKHCHAAADRIEELEKSPDVIAMLNAANVMDSQSELITKLQQQVDAVKECQVYVVELDDCEIRWIKESDVLAALKIRTKQ